MCVINIQTGNLLVLIFSEQQHDTKLKLEEYEAIFSQIIYLFTKLEA